MNKPSLYSRANDVQRHDAKEIVREYASTLELHSDGKQSLLDVGTGSGDVLLEVLVPSLARGFTRITGSDISAKMVEFCKKCHSNLEGVEFKELDIETDRLRLEFHGQFDRVTSFYCLHWVRNQRKCLENIFNCLRPTGDCLLVFLGSNSVHNVYKILSKHPRWKAYLKDLPSIFSPFFDHPRIGEEYEALLKEAGFVDRRVEVKEKAHAHEGFLNFKDNMKAINPFPLPESEFDEYFETFCDCMNEMGLKKQIPGTEDHRFVVKYRLVVAYAMRGE